MPDTDLDSNTNLTEPVVPVEPTKPVEPDELTEPIKSTEPVAPKQTVQERIDEITRKRREAERDAEYWRNLAMTKEEPLPVKPAIPVETGRPNQENFETVEEYEDALIGWHDEKKSVAAGVVEQQKQQQEALKTFNENAVNVRKEHVDFDEVVKRPVFTDAMRNVISVSKTGPELAYYLGKNPEIAGKIAQMPVEIQPYEIGKLETQIKIAQKTKTATAAPEPITPVGDVSIPGVDTSKMTTEEWMIWNKEHEINKLKQKNNIP